VRVAYCVVRVWSFAIHPFAIRHSYRNASTGLSRVARQAG